MDLQFTLLAMLVFFIQTSIIMALILCYIASKYYKISHKQKNEVDTLTNDCKYLHKQRIESLNKYLSDNFSYANEELDIKTDEIITLEKNCYTQLVSIVLNPEEEKLTSWHDKMQELMKTIYSLRPMQIKEITDKAEESLKLETSEAVSDVSSDSTELLTKNVHLDLHAEAITDNTEKNNSEPKLEQDAVTANSVKNITEEGEVGKLKTEKKSDTTKIKTEGVENTEVRIQEAESAQATASIERPVKDVAANEEDIFNEPALEEMQEREPLRYYHSLFMNYLEARELAAIWEEINSAESALVE